jgi:hypothetical protein
MLLDPPGSLGAASGHAAGSVRERRLFVLGLGLEAGRHSEREPTMRFFPNSRVGGRAGVVSRTLAGTSPHTPRVPMEALPTLASPFTPGVGQAPGSCTAM